MRENGKMWLATKTKFFLWVIGIKEFLIGREEVSVLANGSLLFSGCEFRKIGFN